jgi:RNA polymerase sigma factor (sigma-70 family)
MLEMTEFRLQQVCSGAYETALAEHGDLGLTLDGWVSKIERVIQASPPNQNADVEWLCSRVESLHTSDLYLSMSCASGSNTAWARFIDLYGRFINAVAEPACSYQGWAGDVAGAVLAGLFMPGTSGVSRIGTYDGTARLATWLRAVVLNRAADERRLRSNRLEDLDVRDEWPAPDPTDTLETHYRTLVYGDKIVSAFQHASSALSEDDRYLLLMRYEEGLQVSEIARLRGVSPPAITRRIKRICHDLKHNTIDCLRHEHDLPQQAIDECVRDVVDTPYYTIIPTLKGART